jgi:hypothetical protein
MSRKQLLVMRKQKEQEYQKKTYGPHRMALSSPPMPSVMGGGGVVVAWC